MFKSSSKETFLTPPYESKKTQDHKNVIKARVCHRPTGSFLLSRVKNLEVSLGDSAPQESPSLTRIPTLSPRQGVIT